MFKILLAFLLIFGGFFFGIQAFRSTTKKQKLELTKLVGYSILCSVLTVLFLTTFVLIF